MSLEGIAPNAKRLLWAGFLAILAAGIGFGIRGGILANWAAEFGFTGAQLGAIGGAGFTGFCFGIIIGGVVVDKIGYGKLIVAAFLFHVLSAFITFAATGGQAQATAYMFLYHRHVRFRAGQWHARSGGQPAGLHALPQRPHALLEHSPCELAGRPGARRPRRLDSRGRHAGELEAAARTLPRADRALRHRVLRSAIPEVRSVRQRTHHRRRCCRRWECWVRSSLASWSASSSRSSSVASSRSSLGDDFYTSAAWGIFAWAVALGLLLIVAIKTNFSIGSMLLFVLFVDACSGRCGRARHRWLDSEHHRQHPDAGAGQDPLRVHVAADVLAALLRALHRDAPQSVADRPAVHVRPCWPPSACDW